MVLCFKIPSLWHSVSCLGRCRAIGGLRRIKEKTSFFTGNLLILTLSWMVWFPAMRMVNTYHQVYTAELGATAAILGMISAISTVVISLSRIPGGYIADRYGRKKIVVTMTFVIALTYLIYAFAPSWEWILVGAVVANLSLIYQPALLAIRADSVPPEKRGVSFAFMDFLSTLICLPAPLIAAYLVATYGLIGGMRVVYITATMLGITAAAIRMFLKETLAKERGKNYGTAREIGGDFKREYVNALKFIFKKLPGLAVFYVLFNFAFMGIFPFLAYYAIYFLGLSNETWGYIFFLSQTVYLLVLLPIGFFVDRIGRRKVLMTIVGLTVFGALVYGLAPRASGEMAFYVFAGLSMIMISNAAFFTSASALEADIVPREKRGRTSAVLGLVSSFSAAAGQTLAGVLYEEVNPRFPFFVAVAVLLAALTVVLLLIREPKKKEL